MKIPLKPAALVLGPSREAPSGLATHLNGLLASKLQEGFELYHFQAGGLASPLRLAHAIARRDAVVVHLNTSLTAKPYFRDLAYLVVAKLFGARVLVQKHGGSLQAFCPQPWLAPIIRWTLRLADAVVVLSRAELVEYENQAINQTVACVPNGVDCAPYRKYERVAAREVRLLYLGRLAQGKGLDEVLESFAFMKAQDIPASLVIAGSGPEEAALRRRARELGLDERAIFAGAPESRQGAVGMQREEKLRLLSTADVLLLPSHAEGLPYVLLEAMAAGVVPVVTRVGAMPEVIEAGRHGLFVPVGDAPAIARAVAELAADRDWLARMSAACRSRIAAAYSIDRAAAGFAALYGVVCAQRAVH